MWTLLMKNTFLEGLGDDSDEYPQKNVSAYDLHGGARS